MPDNVLTVRFEDEGGGASSAGPSSSSGAIRRGAGGGAGGGGSSGSTPGSAHSQSFDPAAIAARRLEQEQRQSMVQREYNLQKFGQFGGGMANMASRLGLPSPMTGLVGRGAAALGVGGMIGGGLLAAGIAADRFTSGMADKHAALGFSPDVAVAGANQQLSQTNRNLREAQVLGPALANYMEQQTKLQEIIAELLLPIKQFIVETVAGGWQYFIAILESIRDALVEMGWLAKKDQNEMRDDAFLREFLAIGVPGIDIPLEVKQENLGLWGKMAIRHRRGVQMIRDHLNGVRGFRL